MLIGNIKHDNITNKQCSLCLVVPVCCAIVEKLLSFGDSSSIDKSSISLDKLLAGDVHDVVSSNNMLVSKIPVLILLIVNVLP